MDKICSRCKLPKDSSLDFYKRRGRKNGTQPRCKACCALVAAEYRETHRKYLNDTNREWRENNRTRESENLRKRNERYTRLGSSLTEYDTKFQAQNHGCAICGVHQRELKRPLCFDHCHQTGKVRGLLCSSCNQKLGWFENNKIGIEAYLASYKE